MDREPHPMDGPSWIEVKQESLKTLLENKLAAEFSLFLQSYTLSKESLSAGQELNAYNNIMNALRQWARIAVIEKGQSPDGMKWDELKHVHTGISKLYEELTLGSETIKERVELVLLACEFSLMSKMESCCATILRILGSRIEPWKMDELVNHEDLLSIGGNMQLVLNKLVNKLLIREVIFSGSNEFEALEIRYTI